MHFECPCLYPHVLTVTTSPSLNRYDIFDHNDPNKTGENSSLIPEVNTANNRPIHPHACPQNRSK
jgi:hypothetical protein